jgi:DNA-binding NtrC family response regulator
MLHSILVVDDELSIRESFSLILKGRYRLRLAASGEAALKIISDQRLDMVYLDIRMPGMNGLETLKRIKEIDPELEVIMITAVNDLQSAGEAVKLGARDYVVKPFDVDHILKLTEQILRKKALLAEGNEVQKKAAREIQELIGQHERIIEISKTLSKIKRDERILILGEAGTEKELVANIIHEQSSRSAFPCKVAHLCPCMTVPQIKALFFGMGKGESVVDLEARSGLFEQAKNGSVFLNNLELLPEEIFKNVCLLEFSRTGSSLKIPIESRLMGGASADLVERNKEIFDFFSEVHIHLPPLRERTSDIPLLANHFCKKYSSRYEKEVKIDPPALEVLTNYSWPGNTHQLEGLMERLILSSATGQIEVEDLPIDILIEGDGSPGSDFISNFEKEYICAAFERSGKSKAKTAAFLGINPLLLETKI